MKAFLLFMLVYSLTSCAGQKTMNIYITHCDSLFYAEGDKFDAKKLKVGKMTDSVFITTLFNSMSTSVHKIAFKPYTDICTEDGMGPFILNWKALFSNRGFNYMIPPTEEAEDNYFGEMSVYKFAFRGSSGNSDTDYPVAHLPPPPPPPPPPKIVVTEDGKPTPGNTEDVFFVKAKNVVTFLLSANDAVYYYEGIFTGALRKTDFTSIGKLIKQYKGKIDATALLFIIKPYKGFSSTKNVIDLLDEMTMNKIPPGHYAEMDITDNEIKSINNYKEN